MQLSFHGGCPVLLFGGITRTAKTVHHNTPGCLVKTNVDKNIKIKIWMETDSFGQNIETEKQFSGLQKSATVSANGSSKSSTGAWLRGVGELEEHLPS